MYILSSTKLVLWAQITRNKNEYFCNLKLLKNHIMQWNNVKCVSSTGLKSVSAIEQTLKSFFVSQMHHGV